MYEMPPILKGTERQQIAALRDYLVRLVRSQGGESSDNTGTPAIAAANSGKNKSSGDTATALDKLRTQAGQLRSLIVKTAEATGNVVRNVESVTEELHEEYLARSEFGTFNEDLNTRIETTARNIVESYDYAAMIEELQGGNDALNTYLTNIRGEIRRGWITDPDTGEVAMGIAIAEKLEFTGETRTVDGVEYEVLKPGQNLGIYTASGWQFWLNGAKRGWFDSVDSMLHVRNMTAEDGIFMGTSFEIVNSDGFGIKYVG